MKTSYDTVEITQWSVLMNEEILQQIAAIEEQVAKLKELVLGASPNSPQQQPIQAPEPSSDASPEQLLVWLFEAVIQRNSTRQSSTDADGTDAINDSSLRTALQPILHSSITESERTLDAFFRYHWKTFESRYAGYLKSAEDPTSFEVARRQSNHRAETVGSPVPDAAPLPHRLCSSKIQAATATGRSARSVSE